MASRLCDCESESSNSKVEKMPCYMLGICIDLVIEGMMLRKKVRYSGDVAMDSLQMKE